MKHHKRKNGGFVLFFLIIALTIAILFSGALFMYAYLTGNFSIQHRGFKQAYYTACAGAEYARYIIKHSATYNPPTDTSKWPKDADGHPMGTNTYPLHPFGDSNAVVIIIASSGADYQVTAKGTSSTKQTKSLSVLTTADGAPKTWD